MKESIINDDAILFSAICDGDRTAFNILFKKYYTVLCTYACRFVNLEDAEEIVQNLMVSLWKKRTEIHINTSLRQYLFRSVYLGSLNNISHNETKKRIERIYYDRLKDNEYFDTYQFEELKERMTKAIDDLPESYKEVFIMHRHDNLSYKEIADKLNISTKTVDYRIQQALKILKVQFKDYLPLMLFMYNTGL